MRFGSSIEAASAKISARAPKLDSKGLFQERGMDRSHCEECENCVFKTKTMEGERVEGCWPKDGGRQRRRLRGEAERIYLHGLPAQMKDLSIVPHYKMWGAFK